jgi:hypothetical protein
MAHIDRKIVVQTGRGGMINYQEIYLGRKLTLREKSCYPLGRLYALSTTKKYVIPSLHLQFETLFSDLYNSCDDDLETVFDRAATYFEGEISRVEKLKEIIAVLFIDNTESVFKKIYKEKK